MCYGIAATNNSLVLVIKCPTNQFRFKTAIEAKAGDWVMQRREGANSWPYNECKQQQMAKNWANGMIPQTEACYRAALDFTTLSDYKMDFLLASVRSKFIIPFNSNIGIK